jgi:hypothetical protein
MDALEQMLQAAGPLLRRVDEVISTVGAPPGHRVWSELRRVRVLPGDAVHAVAALRPAELSEAAPVLRADARTCAGVADSLPPRGGWAGDAAGAYDAARRRAAEHLSGGPESLDERLEATADLADALVEWIGQARAHLAATLADVLVSAEAVALSDGSTLDPAGDRAALAAADVGARVLHTVAGSYELAADLLDGSADLADVRRSGV